MLTLNTPTFLTASGYSARAADGSRCVVLLVSHKPAQCLRHLPAWRVLWSGPQAAAWHDANEQALRAGACVEIDAASISTHTTGPSGEVQVIASAIRLVAKKPQKQTPVAAFAALSAIESEAKV